MIGAYVYTPEIWPPLTGAVFLGVLGLYSWRRRDVPAALPLAAGALFSALWLLGLALEAAATTPATTIAWHKFQAAWHLPTATAMACFALEYAYPGRWLTRRNLTLLALPPLLALILIVANDARFMWSRLEIAPNGAVERYFATPGAVLAVYGLSLGLVNAAAFLWLFIRSPQHRWPAALMLLGDFAGRGLYAIYMLDAHLPSLALLDAFVAALLLNWIMYAIALFGFHIFDPLPAARATALAQMPEGMVVFDARWQVANLNPAAASILSLPATHTRGKLLAEILPEYCDEVARCAKTDAAPTEISLGTGAGLRQYALDFSTLRDFRGLRIGHLLMLRDVTERRRAQAQLLEQQRTLATLEERERLARELHDGVAQALAAAHLQASTARLLLARGETAQVDECLGSLTGTALQAEADVRDYLWETKTAISDSRPFFPTLRTSSLRFTRQYGLPVELTVPPQLEEQGLAPIVEVQLLRIIQEALSNVRKHAAASCVRVDFSLAGPQVRIVIVDDGHGFDPAAIAGQGEGYGLRAMRERAEAVGGSLAVSSVPGQGTQVVVHVPLKE